MVRFSGIPTRSCANPPRFIGLGESRSSCSHSLIIHWLVPEVFEPRGAEEALNWVYRFQSLVLSQDRCKLGWEGPGPGQTLPRIEPLRNTGYPGAHLHTHPSQARVLVRYSCYWKNFLGNLQCVLSQPVLSTVYSHRIQFISWSCLESKLRYGESVCDWIPQLEF